MRNSNSRSRIVSTRAVIAVIFVLFTMGLPLVGASTASAEFIGALVEVVVESEHGRHSTSFEFNPNIPEHARERILWAWGRREIHTQGGGPGGRKLIGTIESMTIDFDGDPVVDIAFSAMAGSADTTFTITSALVSFDSLTNPIAEASASLELTDTGGSDGASLELVGGAASVYRAEYNGGDLFSGMVGAFDFDGAGADSTDASSLGPVTLSGTVTSIQGKLKFKLSAEDFVSGETRFEVTPTVTPIPEPSSWAMLATAAIGLFACGWRWRRLR